MARDDDQDSADLARERELEWQQIIENFGERAVLAPEDEALFEAPRAPEPAAAPTGPTGPTGEDEDVEQDEVHPADAFVPPTPPPVPRPPLDRLLAWLGVFGVPTVVLVCVVAGIGVPTWFGMLMAAAFIGGFGYLVYRMSDEPREPWDDGAVL